MIGFSRPLSLLLTFFALQGAHGDFTNNGFTTCNVGNNNVRIPDNFTNMTFGTIGGGGMEFRLDGFRMHGGCSSNFTIGKEHTLSLATTTKGSFFIGFLWRLSGPTGLNVTGLMTANPSDPFIQESPICINQQLGGMMHKEDSKKTEVSAKFRINEPFESLKFDITAVVQQNASTLVSEYYYSTFSACATDFTAAPVTPPPTPEPITPTPAPVIITAAPVPAPTSLPTPIPTTLVVSPSCPPAGKGSGKGDSAGGPGDCDGSGKGDGKGGKGDVRKKRGRRALRLSGAANNGYW